MSASGSASSGTRKAFFSAYFSAPVCALYAALSLLSTTLAYDGWSIPWYRFLLPLGYYTSLRHTYSYPEREPYGLKNELLRKRIARAIVHARRAHFSHGHATRIADIANTVNGRCVSSGKVAPYFTTTSTSCWVVMPTGMDVHSSGSN